MKKPEINITDHLKFDRLMSVLVAESEYDVGHMAQAVANRCDIPLKEAQKLLKAARAAGFVSYSKQNLWRKII